MDYRAWGHIRFNYCAVTHPGGAANGQIEIDGNAHADLGEVFYNHSTCQDGAGR
jgi:hypothetical protein